MEKVVSLIIKRTDEETRKSREMSPDTDYARRWDCYYLIKGCLGAMECWMNDGMQEEPEYLAHYMAEKIYTSGGRPKTGNKALFRTPGSTVHIQTIEGQKQLMRRKTKQ